MREFLALTKSFMNRGLNAPFSYSGGSLSAIVALYAASAAHRVHLTYQLLLLPVLDHTATPASPSWLQRPYAPWLTPARILWYRSLYFNQSSSQPIAAAKSWEASPALAPDEVLRGLPPTWIAVAGEDVLRAEAEEFADRLRNDGVLVQLKCYEGVCHSVLALCGEPPFLSTNFGSHVAHVRHPLAQNADPGLWCRDLD